MLHWGLGKIEIIILEKIFCFGPKVFTLAQRLEILYNCNKKFFLYNKPRWMPNITWCATWRGGTGMF